MIVSIMSDPVPGGIRIHSSQVGNPKEKIRIEPVDVPVPTKTPAPSETPVEVPEKEPVA